MPTPQSLDGKAGHEDPPARDHARIQPKAAGRPSQEDIAAAAYQIYLAEGSQPGQDVQHWYQAEAQLTAIATMTMETEITVRYEAGAVAKTGTLSAKAVV